MDRNQFARLKDLFDELADLPPAERTARLAEERRRDTEIAEQLEALLRNDVAEREIWLDAIGHSPDPAAAGATVELPTQAVDSPSSEGLLGARLGSIRIQRVIGRGGMGDVYRGWDDALERPVAIKIIRRPIRPNDEASARFLREARLLSRLDHPNICRVYGLVDSPQGQCLVLEYIEGRTLREAMNELDDARRLGVAAGLLAALSAAHEQGIVHRDLKPENFMLLEDGGVKVLDFGIARAAREPRSGGLATRTTQQLSPTGEAPETSETGAPTGLHLTRHGSMIGTLSYMSPEQALGKPVTTASDMYSLGLVLQELWTGEGPYKGDSAAQVLLQAQRGAVTAVTGMPRELARLVERLRSVDPAARPTARDAARTVDHFRRRPARRRRALLTGAAALLSIGALVAALFANLRLEPPLVAPEQRGRTLLLPIVNATGDAANDWVERGLWAMVLQTLDDTAGIEAVPRDVVDRLLEEEQGELADLTREELLALTRNVGAEITLLPVLKTRADGLELAVRSVNVNGSQTQWRLRGEEPTGLARDLGTSVIRRLRPDAAFRDLYDRFSPDPFVNRLYAQGVDQLRTDGANEAAPYFEVALDVEPGLDWARVSLATADLELAEYDRAKQLTEEVLENPDLGDDRTLRLAALRTKATIAYQQGDLEAADAGAHTVLDESRAAGLTDEEAAALVMLGDIERSRLDFHAAEAHYRAALEIRRKAGDQMSVAHSLHTLGVVAEESGDAERAEQLLNEALEIETENHFRHLGGMTHNSLGILYNHQGDLERARSHFEQAIALYEEVGARQHLANTLSNLATAWHRGGNWKRAYEVNSRAQEIARDIDSASTRGFLAFNQAFLALEVGQLEEAERNLEIARAQYGDDDPDVLIVSALLADRHGDPRRAYDIASRAKEVSGDQWDAEREGYLRSFAERAGL